MIDIPILPSAIAPGITSQEPGLENIALKVPQGLEKLVKGALVDATVVRQEHVTNPLLRFNAAGITNNELPISTRLALPDGVQVQIKVLSNTLPGSAEAQIQQRATGQPVKPDFQAQILTVDGKPLPPGQAAGTDTIRALLPNFPGGPAATAASSTAAPTTTGATIVNVSGGSFVNATVITPEQGATAYLPQGNAGQPLQPADTLRLHIVASTLPSRLPEGTSPAPQAAQPSATVASQVNAYTKLSIEGASLQQATESFAARGFTPPPALPQSASVAPLGTATNFTGIVIGTERSGEAVLQTPLGLIRLPAGLSLPQGTALTLETITVLPAADKTAAAELPSGRISALISRDFGELAALLTRADGGVNMPPPQAVIPHAADRQFAAKLLWFISGVSQGSAGTWLGPEARRALEDSGNRAMLQKLEGTFHALKGMLAEPNPQGWVSLPFPVWDGEKLQQGMFHLHRDPESEKEQRRKKDSRFMVEVSLESTGEMQIDGLVQDNSLDLVIRTHVPMPDDMRSDILRIFEDTNAQTGFTGTVIFQSLVNFPVHPMAGAEEQGIVV